MDKTLLKGLHVLEAVADTNGRGRTAREIAELTGLSLCNVHRTLRTLVHADFISREEATGRYFTGFKVLSMGGRGIVDIDIRRLAAPLLAELSHLTGETAFLALLQGDSICCVDSVSARDRVSASLSIGTSAPADSTAAGLVILEAKAGGPRTPESRDCYRPGGTPETAMSPWSGAFVCMGGWRPAIGEIAAAVFDGLGEAKASVGIFAPADRIDDARASIVAQHVLGIAAAISERWGFTQRS
ncbi:IclR family transcriptional regulator [Paraburkholderia sp. BR13439]|uniref:IclR family transcriptional regulator n=1 Tax=unclassified Paraburkholderia TaxID=2615204 RepID=UPI0034CDA68B